MQRVTVKMIMINEVCYRMWMEVKITRITAGLGFEEIKIKVSNKASTRGAVPKGSIS